MRVISQSGNLDFPYEQIIIHRDENEIWYRLCGDASKRGILANYTSPEKAEKAMEMCRLAYSGELFLCASDYVVEDIDLSQELEEKIRESMKNNGFIQTVPNNPVIECRVFQFPADEDVELEDE